MYISTSDELAAFCERARSFDAVAVDTEFLRERTYHAKLCLVQVATPDECVVIDPLTIEDLEPLARLMADEEVIKVFHACSQDMEVLYHVLGTLPAPIFDTQVAAAFLGERQQSSYNALVHAFCGVTLPKSESLTDWSARPLTPEQIDYAVDDVRYLIRVFDVISERLVETGRASWVMDETRPLTKLEHYVLDPRSAYRKVKRVSGLTRRQQGVARELAAWRERRAMAHDIPRRWIMSDEVLVALAKRPPRTVPELRRVRGTEELSDRDVQAVLAAAANGARCPAENLPNLERGRKAMDAELESIVDLMYALIRLVSERSGVATSIIATREDLAGYIEHPEKSPLRDGWRFELVGTLLDDLLAGNLGLTVKGRKIEML